ncbi:hypothetical protein JW756_06230 [Candidatus Woesearchaeota archaeon]|nr:hypothetical protein [Candidatus Woesearchaeota archaeon]
MSSTSEKIISVSVHYLGPATKNFYDYLAKEYMKTGFDKVGPTQVKEVIKWARPLSCLFIGKEKTEKMVSEIEQTASQAN